MKYVIILFLFLSSNLFSMELDSIVTKHHSINKYGMMTLGTWAIANIGVGIIQRSRTHGETKYFHEGNAGWNLINLGIASFGLYSALNPDYNLGLGEFLSSQKSIESILLLNAGLDIAYMSIGLYLKERSKNASNNPERLRGYGNAMILQGAFLLLFDIGLYTIHTNFSSSFLQSIESIEIGLNSISIRF